MVNLKRVHVWVEGRYVSVRWQFYANEPQATDWNNLFVVLAPFFKVTRSTPELSFTNTPRGDEPFLLEIRCKPQYLTEFL